MPELTGFLGPAYLWVKAAHVTFVIFWMAGLFLLPRFYVYHQEAAVGSPEERVWIERDGDELLVSTVKGRRKHLNIEADPRVTVLVYPKDNPYSYVAVPRTSRRSPAMVTRTVKATGVRRSA